MVHFGFLYWYYSPGAVKTLNWTILRVVKKKFIEYQTAKALSGAREGAERRSKWWKRKYILCNCQQGCLD